MSEQKDQQIKGLSAQLQAHQGMCNELMQLNINLRTNLILMQDALNQFQKDKDCNDAMVVSLNNKVAELEAKIAPVAEELPQE